MQTYSTVCKLLGAFLEPASLWTQLRGALDADSAMAAWLDLRALVGNGRDQLREL
ncbi:HEATR2 [Symbiodinium natans]|uniref:HEATR2 protein n=1 Tax=Symbiodinium natans TaxID=878477 RepID=A0A812U5S3_9DINO|nr:HEATR2 [Symbiodinium natans]